MQQQEDATDLAMLAPDDVLGDVLRRVSPRGLAACRCVCRAWRALIDERRLLRADLLPRSLARLFLTLHDLDWADFFARPGVDSSGYLMPSHVADHCNGLVLEYDNRVTNPATGQTACLPDHPPPPVVVAADRKYFVVDEYLAFDPTESPQHFQVFSIPAVLPKFNPVDHAYDAMSLLEWPPSPLVLNVFSSNAGRWEERSFLRQGEAAGTIGDLDRIRLDPPYHSVCWRGALYVHRQSGFVWRISLSNNHTYRVIKPPGEIETSKLNPTTLHLGRSQKGVYYGLIGQKHLWVWILDDSRDDQPEWILKYRSAYDGLALPCSKTKRDQHGYRPWTVTDANNCAGYFRNISYNRMVTIVI
ncbi:hypothetical protein BS78_05G091900 [Paspalum vaginatum]|nr:hypothetical protein BS78_05G091900 [Paspalum vaginatum]